MEPEKGCANSERLGPYEVRGRPRIAFEIARKRNEEWDAGGRDGVTGRAGRSRRRRRLRRGGWAGRPATASALHGHDDDRCTRWNRPQGKGPGGHVGQSVRRARRGSRLPGPHRAQTAADDRRPRAPAASTPRVRRIWCSSRSRTTGMRPRSPRWRRLWRARSSSIV